MNSPYGREVVMSIPNVDVARIFDQVADLLEVNGESFYRVRAYRNASRTIRDLSTPLGDIVEDPDQKLEDLPGIGKDLASRIVEILENGDLKLREELESKLPGSLLEVMKVPGLGPRKTHELFLELGISDLKGLEKAARSGEIRKLKGFGEKTERNILEGIYAIRSFGDRMFRAEAELYAGALLEHMRGVACVTRMEIAGSYRRLAETVGDLDLLATCDDSGRATQRFLSFPRISKVIATGPTRSSVIIAPGLQVDLRIVDDDCFGSALQYFTGSQAHNVALRGIALRKGLKLNEYGLFDGKNRVAGKTEEDVYEALGLPWIPPELRENRGEIRLGYEGLLPELVTLDDVKGDLHVHTVASDGRNTLEEMVYAARRLGYEYIAITDHSARVVSGLDEKGLLGQWSRIEEIDSRTGGIHVLKGVEVDILKDGSLDIPDDVLEKADYVVAAVHFDTGMSRADMTRRIAGAVRHPHVNALAHPTGRKINSRPPYDVNIEDILVLASHTGTALELNANPERLDIDDATCRSARDHGVKVSIATDAHSVKALELMGHGVNQARRGWLERSDVVNTRGYKEFRKLVENGC